MFFGRIPLEVGSSLPGFASSRQPERREGMKEIIGSL